MEREYNLKYLLNVMGCRIIPYYLGAFCFDYIMYLLVFLIVIISSLIINFEIFNNYFGWIFANYTLFGLNIITVNYMVSFIF